MEILPYELESILVRSKNSEIGSFRKITRSDY